MDTNKMDKAFILTVIGTVVAAAFAILGAYLQHDEKKKSDVKSEISALEAKNATDKLISLQEKGLLKADEIGKKSDELDKANKLIIELNNKLNERQEELLKLYTGGGNFPIIEVSIHQYSIQNGRDEKGYFETLPMCPIIFNILNKGDYILDDIKVKIREGAGFGDKLKLWNSNKQLENQYIEHVNYTHDKLQVIGTLPPKVGATNNIYQAYLGPNLRNQNHRIETYWVDIQWGSGKYDCQIYLNIGEDKVTFKEANVIMEGKEIDYKKYVKIISYN